MNTLAGNVCTWVLVMMTFGLVKIRSQEFETANGRVRGKRINIAGKSLDVFYGIPYARPPVGDLRFKHPQPVDPWRPKVKDATKETPSCIQPKSAFSAVPTEDILVTPNDFSEDCLHLNIWKPSFASNGSNLAVMVWIYGGRFSIGSARLPVYNAQYLVAENDVIVVTLNYRVGPLGFAYLGSNTIPGNMGMMDQVEAIRWVRTNIQHFGGDRDRITLFGQSAGGTSVGLHLLSPLTKDLFHNGILQSGVPVNSVVGGSLIPLPHARANTKTLSEALNCTDKSESGILECLKSVDAQSINSAFNEVTRLGVTFFPVMDGHFMPADPMTIIERGEHKKANILTGVTKDEITLLYYSFMNPANKTFLSTGKPLTYQDFEATASLGLSNKATVEALKTFYVSEESPPLDYLHIIDQLGSDISAKCPTLQFSSLYAGSSDVYLFSLDHRISTMPHPEWMGVPHGYDLQLLFGMPLNDSQGFTQDEKELSKRMMTYWSNFAKSGNPNSPVPVTSNWPVFNKENLTYLALDVGSNLATKFGFRRHQCAFVNDILPLIQKDEDIQRVTTYRPDCRYPVSGGRRQCPGCMYVILSLLTVFFWMLQG